MKQYIILYLGGAKAPTKEEGEAGKGKWQAWLAALGDAVINPGTPMMNPKKVTIDTIEDAVGISAMTGYTIVQAETMEEALKMAQDCPYVEMDGGALTVAELMQM